MTRSYGSSRSSTRRIVPAQRRAPDPRFTRYGFTCFRLIPIGQFDAEDGAFAPIELMSTMNAMGAFMLLR